MGERTNRHYLENTNMCFKLFFLAVTGVIRTEYESPNSTSMQLPDNDTVICLAKIRDEERELVQYDLVTGVKLQSVKVDASTRSVTRVTVEERSCLAVSFW